MKKLAVLTLVAFVLTISLNAQTMDEKNLTDKGSFGQKNLKKAPKKIYIASFKTFFQVSASAVATSTGGRNLGGGSFDGATRTEMAVAIDGVDEIDFITAVDGVYQQYKKGLEDQGFEIITAEEAGKTPFYLEWQRKTGGRISTSQMKGYVMAIPTGYEYYIRKENSKGKEKGTFIDRTPELSGDLDDAIVVDISFVFPAIDMDTKGGLYSSGSSVSAKVNFRLATAAMDGTAGGNINYTQVKYIYGDGPGAGAEAYLINSIKSKVEIPDVFAEKKFKERTSASITPAYYSIVFTEDVKTEVTHTAKCDAGKYIASTQSLMNQVLNYSLEQLKDNSR